LVLLAPHRRDHERLEQLVTRQALVSTQAVARVSRFDGRTRIVAVRTDQGWQRGLRIRWTRDSVELLRGDVREVLLSRWFRHARVPLAWVPKRSFR
jgi:hypothetical protein